TPLILQPRGSLVRSGQKELAKAVFQLLFGRGIIAATTVAIALSTTEMLQLERGGFPRSKVKVIPNMIALPSQGLPSNLDARRELGLPEDKLIILFMGRLHRAKGVD